MYKNLLQNLVADFHRKYGVWIPDLPTMPFPESRMRRISKVFEEALELELASSSEDMVGCVDAIIDLLYVVLGAACEFGIDVTPFFWEVHRTNMAKVLRNGDIIKPEGWKKPDIQRMLKEQG